jgi:hypothetical protein
VLERGEVIDNRTLCDLFGVANTGGIRVNNRRSQIVLVSNNTDPTYRNEWRDEILHFVGRGSVGPQTLARQNKTLANATRRGYALHLFEVFEKRRYTYAGEVELASEPYMSDQPDARAHDRFVWIFPLRNEERVLPPVDRPFAVETNYLPYGAYAVICADLTDEQRALVDETLDRLKEAGVSVFDYRDVEQRRYEKALAQWHENVLDRVRAKIKGLIAGRRRAAKDANRPFTLVDDELRVNSASTEAELRTALMLLDYDDPTAQERLFEEARQAVPMPDPPKSSRNTNVGELEKPMLRRNVGRADFSGFT